MFAADGRKLFFQRIEATGGNTPNSVQIYSVALERLDRDPDDAEERAEAEAPAAPAEPGTDGATTPAGPRRGPEEERAPRETKIDWAA